MSATTQALPDYEPFPRGHILLADNDLCAAESRALALRRSGHTVELARDGREAIALLQRQVFDLVLLEILMPETDGLEVLRWLRGRAAGRITPVIAMCGGRSVLPGAVALDLAEALGASGRLHKPFSLDELFSAVAFYMDTSPEAARVSGA